MDGRACWLEFFCAGLSFFFWLEFFFLLALSAPAVNVEVVVGDRENVTSIDKM